MRIEFSFIRSIVGRRILLLFVVCALLPVSLLAYFSLRQVSDNLENEARARLTQVTRNAGMSVLEGLSHVSAEMEALAASGLPLKARTYSAGRGPDRGYGPNRLSGVMLVAQGREPQVVAGQAFPLPDRATLRPSGPDSRRPVLITDNPGKAKGRVLVVIPATPDGSRDRLLVGEVNPQYIWDLASNALLPAMDISILDGNGLALYGATALHEGALSRLRDAVGKSFSGSLEWNNESRTYLVSYRSVFLKGGFEARDWVVVVSQSREDAFASLSRFTRTFILIFLLTLGTVLFFSSIQIRRNLVPLTRLREGTRRIAQGDFESRVQVRSGDEFEELATSFNAMSDHLGEQFRALSDMGHMVRLLLTALDRDKVGEVVLDNLHAVVACDCTGLSFMTSETTAETVWRLHIGKHVGTQDRSFVHLQEGDLLAFKKMPESLRVDSDQHFFGLLAPMRGCGVRTFFVLPLVIDGRLTAVLTLGYIQTPANNREDLVRARQLADQIAVALFNASLIEDLAGLNWGTLTALARAVDAKSPWTGGHSERVTSFALELGKAMGLPSNELELLQRGGLLHDIGKIGVPGTLLDKPGKLTEEEYTLVKTHPEKGGRILEPIPAYADVIPLVVQHHERFDGQGYPHGLAGEAISLGGRIMAVADVYDALISDRPYREGWELDRVISHIEHEAGHQFDPRVVEAFLWIMDSRGRGVAHVSEQALSIAL